LSGCGERREREGERARERRASGRRTTQLRPASAFLPRVPPTSSSFLLLLLLLLSFLLLLVAFHFQPLFLLLLLFGRSSNLFGTREKP
jgi:hypothetical protein